MIHTGKLLHMELYDDMMPPYTNVQAMWEARHSRHPGHCIVTNAHWHDPGPAYCGNYKAGGRELSRQFAEPFLGFGWSGDEPPEWAQYMAGVDNFLSTIPALRGGERLSLDYGSGVGRPAERTWFGRDGAGEWSVEVTTDNYTLTGIVERMEALGIVDGMVLDGSGSSQWYDGETRIYGDGRRVYSYLLMWFETDKETPGGGDKLNIIEPNYTWNGALTKRTTTDRIILHHAAGNGTAESIHKYHVSLGWKGIAYHYYVRKDGTIYRGRPEDAVGGHTSGYNSRSIGICAEGNFETDVMSDAQRDAIRALVLDIRTRYPDTQTIKHKDVAATACPGKNYPFDYIAAADPDPEDTPVEPTLDWETEKALARDWAMLKGISDGERPEDAVKRVELWVTLWRMFGGEK